MQNNIEGSYWPELETRNIKTPINILKEQGENLKKITDGVLTYSISKKALEEGLTAITFDVVAPLIDNLKYNLFRISYHSIDIFPLDIIYYGKGKATKKVEGWDVFERSLKDMLSSEKTKNILEKLLAHSKAASEV